MNDDMKCVVLTKRLFEALKRQHPNAELWALDTLYRLAISMAALLVRQQSVWARKCFIDAGVEVDDVLTQERRA